MNQETAAMQVATARRADDVTGVAVDLIDFDVSESLQASYDVMVRFEPEGS